MPSKKRLIILSSVALLGIISVGSLAIFNNQVDTLIASGAGKISDGNYYIEYNASDAANYETHVTTSNNNNITLAMMKTDTNYLNDASSLVSGQLNKGLYLLNRGFRERIYGKTIAGDDSPIQNITSIVITANKTNTSGVALATYSYDSIKSSKKVKDIADIGTAASGWNDGSTVYTLDCSDKEDNFFYICANTGTLTFTSIHINYSCK